MKETIGGTKYMQWMSLRRINILQCGIHLKIGQKWYSVVFGQYQKGLNGGMIGTAFLCMDITFIVMTCCDLSALIVLQLSSKVVSSPIEWSGL